MNSNPLGIRRRHVTFGLGALGVAGALSRPAAAQVRSDRQVTLFVPFPPGGGTDAVARLIAGKLAAVIDAPVVVDNRSGASGTIGIAHASKQLANGQNLVLGQADNLAVAPQLLKAVPYDPVKDLQPIAFIASIPIVLVTASSQPYQTLADVVKAGKADKNLLTFGSAGVGTTPHLSGELFAKAAGIQMQHIAYKGSAPALTDVLGGRISLMCSSISLVVPHLQSGKLRALAVTSGKRSVALPQVPTVTEAAGLPNFDVGTWYGVFAPKGVPAEEVARLNASVNQVLAMPDVAAFIEGQEGGAITRAEPAMLQGRLQADIALWRRVIADANITLD